MHQLRVDRVGPGDHQGRRDVAGGRHAPRRAPRRARRAAAGQPRRPPAATGRDQRRTTQPAAAAGAAAATAGASAAVPGSATGVRRERLDQRRRPRPPTAASVVGAAPARPDRLRTARAIRRGDLAHLALPHALGGDGRRAHPDAGGGHRLLRVVRDRVLVQRDPRRVAALLGLPPGRPRASAGRSGPGGCRCRRRPAACPRRPARRRAPGRWRPPGGRTSANAGGAASRSATALAATACISGPPWVNGKTALSMRGGQVGACTGSCRRAGRAAPCGW